jgi:hypothetical protein
MKITKQLPGGKFVTIIAQWKTEERLEKSCFRFNCDCAGNFFAARSVMDVLNIPDVSDLFLEEVEEVWEQEKYKEYLYRVEILTSEYLGWESTAPIEKYDRSDLEIFYPQKGVKAKRVIPSLSGHLKAPQTDWVTLAYDVKNENGSPVVFINTVYPGRDIGWFDCKDITEREGRVFFDWNHPGE